ncbi:hypothetical protein Tco_0790373 [Tanacetum coccineum]
MASLDHRLNPLFSIKECMSCGALFTKNCGCSKGSLEDKILVPVPDSSQRQPQNCATCGGPVDGLYCRPCAFVRKCLNEGWYTIHDENEILNTSESSNDNYKQLSVLVLLRAIRLQSRPRYKRFRGEQIDDEYERDCEIKIEQLLQDYNGLDIEMRKKERILMEEKSLAISRRIQSICDDDEDDSISLRDIYARYSTSKAITPDLPTVEPEDSLIMRDEHLDTIPEKEPNELIKYNCDDFTTFSNLLFDSNDDFTSSDDESLSDEDVPMKNFKIYSNPLFDDEEIITPKIDPHYFNAESNLIESLLNRDTLIDSSPKFDFLFEEFSGELAHIDPIPPGIEKAD